MVHRHSGQKTPVPPKAKSNSVAASGPSRAPELHSAVKVSSEEEQIVAPPLPPCTLYKVSSGLSEVLSWLKRAADRGYRYVLALDQHKVSDRFAAQTRELLLAADRERTVVFVLSFIPPRSFEQHGNNAVSRWSDLVASCPAYPRPLWSLGFWFKVLAC